MSYINILEDIKKVSSTNDKIKILENNKDVVHLSIFLKYMIDIRVKFYVANFQYEYSKEEVYDDNTAFLIFKHLCDKLNKHELTGNAALEEVASVFSKFTEQQAYWLALCLMKDSAPLGIARKAVNKVWKGLVLDFKVGLAETEDNIDKFEFGEKASLELKLNGIRTIIVCRNGIVEDVYGRSGLSIENFRFLIPSIEHIANGNSFVLDGEVHVNNCLEDTMSLFGFDITKTVQDFTGKNGKISAAWKKYYERKSEIIKFRESAKYSIFDYLEIDEWDNQVCKTQYQARREKLISLIHNIDSKWQLEMPPYHEVKDYDEALEIIEPWIGEGLEGGILKVYNHLYSFKRDRNWIKIKEEVEEDVQILDIYISKQKFNSDGTAKPDMMGEALVTDRFGRKYKIGTGKYLSEDRRIDMWNNKENYINGIYYVTAQRFTEDAAICPRIEYKREDKVSLND